MLLKLLSASLLLPLVLVVPDCVVFSLLPEVMPCACVAASCRAEPEIMDAFSNISLREPVWVPEDDPPDVVVLDASVS